MSVEQDLQDIIDEASYEKEIKDLSETERAKIVRELRKYELSDSFTSLVASEKEIGDAFMQDVVDKLAKDRRSEPEYSQLTRDYLTYCYMVESLEKINNTEGGKAFKIALEKNAKQFHKTITERIELGYDAPTFTELDILKHECALRTSIKAWLLQTISAYDKVTEVKEEQGAY